MQYILIVPYYLKWHYSTGLKSFCKNCKNFVIFILHFFSIKTLLATLFMPFMRITATSKSTSLNMEELLENVIVNFLMRIVGLVVRLVFIIIGFAVFFAVLFLEILLFAVWVTFPALILFLLLTII